MKLKTYHTTVVFFAIFSVLLFSCTKQDNEIEWGLAKVYMPQAIGIYNVPNANMNNYTVDSVNNKINVHLGILRSGLQSANSFSVELSVNNDTINNLISNGTLKNTLLLPEDCYSIPASISVPDGKQEATFYLTVDKTKLNAYAGKKLAVAVRISNPSKYELNSALSTTVISITVNSLLDK